MSRYDYGKLKGQEPFSVFNAVDNWLTQVREASHSFTANNMNQYSAIDTTRQPTYDLSGNMTNDGNGRTYTFDSENRLISGTKSPDTWFEYDYDCHGAVKMYQGRAVENRPC